MTRAAVPPRVRRNVVANYIGSLWTAVISLVFVPMYIKYLGAEAYGLIGFFITIQALLVILDLGLSATANREIARRSAVGDHRGVRDLLRTLEAVFWTAAVIIALTIAALASLVAAYWLRNQQLSSDVVSASVALMGLAIAAQWPASLYNGAFFGLQRHVVLNTILATGATIRAAGALVVLAFISPTITAFFRWYIVITLLQTVAMAVIAWRIIPPTGEAARFSWELVRQQRNFAAGVTAAYVLALILTQLDKILLSRLLPLRSFGYYALASIVALTLYRLVAPVIQAVYPRLTQLAADPVLAPQLHALYHRSAQAIAVLMIPAAALVSLFSYELLLLWTRDPAVAGETHRVLSVLVPGMALYAMAALPYSLQLAHGRTRHAMITNAAAVAVAAPGMVIGVHLAGALGAAVAWLGMSILYLAAHLHFTHRRILAGEGSRSLRDDLLAPLVGSLVTVGVARVLIAPGRESLGLLMALLTVGLLAVTASVLLIPDMRRLLTGALRAMGRG